MRTAILCSALAAASLGICSIAIDGDEDENLGGGGEPAEVDSGPDGDEADGDAEGGDDSADAGEEESGDEE